MKWFKPRIDTTKRLTRRQALDCVPLRNPKVTASQGKAEGALILAYPLPVRPWFAALERVFGRSQRGQYIKRLQLDQLGAATWRLIDGRSTVEQIIRSFAETYQLERRESEIAVTQFLLELGKRGLVAMH